MKKTKKEVTIYSTPTCHYCEVAKEYFKENDIPFTSVNVVEDMEARAMIREKSGQMGVPVIIVGDKVVVGFTPDKGAMIKRELGL